MATVKELKRMCDTYKDCSDCPFGDTCYGDSVSSLPYNADEIVDKWVSEHPNEALEAAYKHYETNFNKEMSI